MLERAAFACCDRLAPRRELHPLDSTLSVHIPVLRLLVAIFICESNGFQRAALPVGFLPPGARAAAQTPSVGAGVTHGHDGLQAALAPPSERSAIPAHLTHDLACRRAVDARRLGGCRASHLLTRL